MCEQKLMGLVLEDVVERNFIIFDRYFVEAPLWNTAADLYLVFVSLVLVGICQQQN